jgi:hypothetical protein
MPTPSTLSELQSMIRAHALELDRLRASIDIQFMRIAQMQAELDLLPHARKRRESLRSLLAQSPSPNGSLADDPQ